MVLIDVCVGVDVDDLSFHATAFLKDTGEVIETKRKPTTKSLESKLTDFQKKFP